MGSAIPDSYRVIRALVGPRHVYEPFAGMSSQGAPVVLKRLGPWSLTPRYTPRFLAAADIWQKAGSGVTRLLEVGQTDGVYFAELRRDADSARALLSALAAKGQRPHVAAVVCFVWRCAQAVADLHASASGAVHGDVCASTVLVETTGSVLLTDVALMPAIGNMGAQGPARIESYSVCPEQVAEGRSYQASDVFRLGLLLYELVMGRVLFDARSWETSLASVKAYRGLSADALPNVPEPFAGLIRRTLSLQPEARPPAEEVAELLGRVMSAQGWQPEAHIAEAFKQVNRPRGEALAEAGEPLTLQPLRAPISSTKVARIAVRKLSAEALQAERAAEAAEVASAKPPLSPEAALKEALVNRGLATAEGYQQAKAYADDVRGALSEAFDVLGLADEEAVAEVEAEFKKVSFHTQAKLALLPVTAEVVALLKEVDAETLGLVPLSLTGGQLLVAMRDPLDGQKIAAVRRATGLSTVVGTRVTDRTLRWALARWYAPNASTLPAAPQASDANDEPFDTGLDLHFETPVPMSISRLFELPRAAPSAPPHLTPRSPPPAAVSLSEVLSSSEAAFAFADEPLKPPSIRPVAAAASPPRRTGPHVTFGPLRQPTADEASRVAALRRAMVARIFEGRGPAGIEAASMVLLVVEVADRLSVARSELDRLEAAAWAVSSHNLAEGRRAADAPAPPALRQFVGQGFDVIESVIGAWLFGRPASSPCEALFAAIWVLSSITGGSRPAPDDPSIQLVANRLALPEAVVKAIRAALHA